MNGEKLAGLARDYTLKHCVLPAGKALRPDLEGLRLYDAPIFGFASAEDSYLLGLAGNLHARVPLKKPREWLDTARTVVSFFLPIPEAIRKSNREDMRYPSPQWMHARIEGQAFIGGLSRYLTAQLEEAGYRAMVPSLDGRFWSNTLLPKEENPAGEPYSSNWSERHVAYACGLGTFCLSRGLITRAGVAGRFGSLVTELEIPPTERPYAGLEDYCTLCGRCARNCPVGAISVEEGKAHDPCSQFLDQVEGDNFPYYGCGKCQVGVPCEGGIPAAR